MGKMIHYSNNISILHISDIAENGRLVSLLTQIDTTTSLNYQAKPVVVYNLFEVPFDISAT